MYLRRGAKGGVQEAILHRKFHLWLTISVRLFSFSTAWGMHSVRPLSLFLRLVGPILFLSLFGHLTRASSARNHFGSTMGTSGNRVNDVSRANQSSIRHRKLVDRSAYPTEEIDVESVAFSLLRYALLAFARLHLFEQIYRYTSAENSVYCSSRVSVCKSRFAPRYLIRLEANRHSDENFLKFTLNHHAH